MRKIFEEQLPLIKLMVSTAISRTQARYLFAHLTSDQFKVISEIAHNLLKGVIPISEADKKTLLRWATPLRKLGDNKLSLKKRRHMLSLRVVKVLINVAMPFIESMLSTKRKE